MTLNPKGNLSRLSSPRSHEKIPRKSQFRQAGSGSTFDRYMSRGWKRRFAMIIDAARGKRSVLKWLDQRTS